MAIQYDGYSLEYASDRLKDNIKFIQLICKHDIRCFYHASSNIQNIRKLFKIYSEKLYLNNKILLDYKAMALSRVKDKDMPFRIFFYIKTNFSFL